MVLAGSGRGQRGRGSGGRRQVAESVGKAVGGFTLSYRRKKGGEGKAVE